jgi:Derlin-2/3
MPSCSLLGLLAFSAPYLPWVLLGFSLLLGHDVQADMLGIVVGHLYYFLEDVLPAVSVARGWRWVRRPLRTPYLLHWLFGTHRLLDRQAGVGR